MTLQSAKRFQVRRLENRCCIHRDVRTLPRLCLLTSWAGFSSCTDPLQQNSDSRETESEERDSELVPTPAPLPPSSAILGKSLHFSGLWFRHLEREGTTHGGDLLACRCGVLHPCWPVPASAGRGPFPWAPADGLNGCRTTDSQTSRPTVKLAPRGCRCSQSRGLRSENHRHGPSRVQMLQMIKTCFISMVFNEIQVL